MTKQMAVETAKYHARRRGEVYIVWSASTVDGARFHWVAPQAHPLPNAWPDVRPEYVTI